MGFFILHYGLVRIVASRETEVDLKDIVDEG